MGLPAVNLVGLDPSAQREYVWVGDDAVDVEASDLQVWGDTGRGLTFKQDPPNPPCVIRTRALTPTLLELVFNYARMMSSAPDPTPEADARTEVVYRNWPAAERAAVAYGVVAIEGGPPVKRTMDAGGWRLSDETLDSLDMRYAGLRLIGHLGNLILADSRPTESEKKA